MQHPGVGFKSGPGLFVKHESGVGEEKLGGAFAGDAREKR